MRKECGCYFYQEITLVNKTMSVKPLLLVGSRNLKSLVPINIVGIGAVWISIARSINNNLTNGGKANFNNYALKAPNLRSMW